MRVSEFRHITEHLNRLHNVDRQACVSTREATQHVLIARRILAELQSARKAVKRSKPADHDNAARIADVVSEWLETADQWAAERTDRHIEAARRRRES